jgi:hypothetical protein
MSEQIRAKLRAAVWAAIAELGENEARAICEECLNKLSSEHYARGSSRGR